MKPDNSEDNAGQCLCPGCPTYDDCMRGKDERLYCSRGTTACDPSPIDCICGDCPVWARYDLGNYYYCMRGAAS